jgi:hypothetical protein
MKTLSDSFSKNYADWSAIGLAMVMGHAPASPDAKPNGKPAQPAAVHGWEGEGGMLKAPKKAAAAPKPALRKAPAKKRPAKKAKAKRRR